MKRKYLDIAVLMAGFLALNYLLITWLMPSKKADGITGQAGDNIVMEVRNDVKENVVSDSISFEMAGNRISRVRLSNYMDSGEPVELLGRDGEFIEFGLVGGSFNKVVTVEDYIITVRMVSDVSEGARAVAPYARIAREKGESGSMMMIGSGGGIAMVDSRVKREDWSDIKSKSAIFEAGAGAFVGFEDRYWQTILSIDSAGNSPRTMRLRTIEGERFQSDISLREKIIPGGQAAEFVFHIYTGPKVQSILDAADSVMPGIARTMDYGWFSFLSRPFLWALTALHELTGNYGLAIIILTLILRALLIPLTRKSYRSMAAMQRLQPEMQRIQKLYRDDKVRLQQEMMALYSKSKVSPLSGFLPLILQIPIFFALYKALVIAVDMRNSGFLWVNDLASADPVSLFNLFGLLPFNVPSWMPVIGLLPIMMGATMWLQQKISSSKATAATPGMGIIKWLPVVFVVLFSGLPAGLILYWTVSNLFGIAQQWLVVRSMR
ncbi:MAG: membrane protein insertase YidC [Alphaproteobacteria bacterium]|nr:membrane protein insertase YidC [Alphaproteobacteria bacterium]